MRQIVDDICAMINQIFFKYGSFCMSAGTPM